MKYVRYGDICQVKSGLDAGADIHAREDYALRLASLGGHVEMVGMLIDRGADIRAQEDRCLSLAVVYGRRGVVEMLLGFGADAAVGIGMIEVLKLNTSSIRAVLERSLMERGAPVVIRICSILIGL